MKIIVYKARTESDRNFASTSSKAIIPHLGMDTKKDYKVTCLYSNKSNFKGFEIRQLKHKAFLVSYDAQSKKIIKWHRDMGVYWERFNPVDEVKKEREC